VLQLSLVQPLLSSQLAAAPAWHAPAEQTSPTVHALPSVQPAALATWVQPVPASQPSAVQTLPSLQLVPGPD